MRRLRRAPRPRAAIEGRPADRRGRAIIAYPASFQMPTSASAGRAQRGSPRSEPPLPIEEAHPEQRNGDPADDVRAEDARADEGEETPSAVDQDRQSRARATSCRRRRARCSRASAGRFAGALRARRARGSSRHRRSAGASAGPRRTGSRMPRRRWARGRRRRAAPATARASPTGAIESGASRRPRREARTPLAERGVIRASAPRHAPRP